MLRIIFVYMFIEKTHTHIMPRLLFFDKLFALMYKYILHGFLLRVIFKIVFLLKKMIFAKKKKLNLVSNTGIKMILNLYYICYDKHI